MPTPVDSLYKLADPQGGYFTTAQASQAGVSRQELYYLRQSGEIMRAAHGIQRLSRYPTSSHEDIIVTCLWAGPEAVASHETALVVYGIGEAMPRTIHITLPRRFRGQRKGVIVHRAQLDPDERTVRDRVPVTTAIRTIADVARLDLSGARAALGDALDRGLVRRGQLMQAVSRYPHAESILRIGEA